MCPFYGRFSCKNNKKKNWYLHQPATPCLLFLLPPVVQKESRGTRQMQRLWLVCSGKTTARVIIQGQSGAKRIHHNSFSISLSALAQH